MEIIIGIDDAGRGPVIGPMVLAGVLIRKEDEAILKEWDVKDSKKLTPEKRSEIEKKLKKKFVYFTEITSAEEIDSRTNMGINLNRIEAIKSASIINHLIKNLENSDKVKVIIDCPSTNTEAWRDVVLGYVDKKEAIELSCEHKADVNHLSCSAASIIAKTARDSEIEKIKKKIGIDFGSGYCADPLTCDFLEKHLEEFKDSGIIRKTWDTFERAVAKNEQKRLF